jgi:hypothetical protein
MRRNEGWLDRLLRVVVAALGWWLAAVLGYGTAGGVIVLVVAGILVITAVTGFCPLYALLHISTRDGLKGGTSGHHPHGQLAR